MKKKKRKPKTNGQTKRRRGNVRGVSGYEKYLLQLQFEENKKTKEAIKGHQYQCWFDGAIKENPGIEVGIGGYVVKDSVIVFEFGEEILLDEEGSNNTAEYLALEEVLDFLLEDAKEHDTILIHGDSMLVVKQMHGRWRMSVEGMYYVTAVRVERKFKELAKRTDLRIKWIPREQNTIADKLSKVDRYNKVEVI